MGVGWALLRALPLSRLLKDASDWTEGPPGVIDLIMIASTKTLFAKWPYLQELRVRTALSFGGTRVNLQCCALKWELYSCRTLCARGAGPPPARWPPAQSQLDGETHTCGQRPGWRSQAPAVAVGEGRPAGGVQVDHPGGVGKARGHFSWLLCTHISPYSMV